MGENNELPSDPKVYSQDDVINMFLQGNKQAPSNPATPAYTPIPPFVPASQRAVAPAQSQVPPKALSLEEVQAMFMQGNKTPKWTGDPAVDSFNDHDPLTEEQKIDRKAWLEYQKALGGKKDPTAQHRPRGTFVSNIRGSAVRGSASTGDEPTVGYWRSIGNAFAQSWIRGEGDESGNNIASALADKAQFETENKNLIKARDELIAKSKTNIVPNLHMSVAEYNQIIKSNNDRIARVDKALPGLFIKANSDNALMASFGGKNEIRKQFDSAMADPRNDFWDALKEGTDADNFGGVALNYLNIGTNVAAESGYQMIEAIGLHYAMAGLGTYFKLAKSTKNVMSAVAVGAATGKDSFDANMRQNMEQKLVALKINPKDLNAVAEFAKNNPEKWLKMFSESHENAVRKGAAEGAVTALASGITGKVDAHFDKFDKARSLSAAIAGKELPKDSIGKAVAKGIGSMAGEMASEGLEEGAVQMATNLVDEKVDVKDTLAATFSGAAAGGVSKGVMGAAGKAGSKIFGKKEATAEQKAMEAEVEAAKNKPVEESDQNVEASPAWPLFQKYGSDIPESELTEDIIKGHNEWAAKYSQTHHVDGSAMTTEEIDRHLDGLELKKTATEAVIRQNRVPPKPPMIHPIDRKNWEKKYGDTHYDSGVPLFDEKLAAQVDAKMEEMKKAGWQPKRPRAVKKGQGQAQAQAKPDQQAAQPQAEAQTQTKPDGSVEPRPSYSGDHNDTDALIAWKKAYDDWNSKYEKTHDWWTGEPLTPKESAAQPAPKAEQTTQTQDDPTQTLSGAEISNDVVDPMPVGGSYEDTSTWIRRYGDTHNKDGTPKSLEDIDKGKDFKEAEAQIEKENYGKNLSPSDKVQLAFKLLRSGKFKSKRKRAKMVAPTQTREEQASKIISLVDELAARNANTLPADGKNKEARDKLFIDTRIKAAGTANWEQFVKNVKTLVNAGWAWSPSKQTLVNPDNQSETVQEGLDRLNKPAAEAKPAPAKPVETRTVGDMQDQLNKLELAGQGDTRQAERLRARIAALKEADAKPEPKPEPVAAQPEQKPVQAAEQPAAKAETENVDVKVKKGSNPIKANSTKISNIFSKSPVINKSKFHQGYDTKIVKKAIEKLKELYAQIKSGTDEDGKKLGSDVKKLKPSGIEQANKLYNELIKLGAIVPDETTPYKFKEVDPLVDSSGNEYSLGMYIYTGPETSYVIESISKDNKTLILGDRKSYGKNSDEDIEFYEISLDKLSVIVNNLQIEKNGGKTDGQIRDEVAAEKNSDSTPASDSMPRDPVIPGKDNEDLIKKLGKQVKDPVRKNSALNTELSGNINAALDLAKDFEGEERDGDDVRMTDEQRKIAPKIIAELFEIGAIVKYNWAVGSFRDNESSESKNYSRFDVGETISINGYVYQFVSFKENTAILRNIKTGESYEMDLEKLENLKSDDDDKNNKRGWKFKREGYDQVPKYIRERDRNNELNPNDFAKASDSEVKRLTDLLENERRNAQRKNGHDSFGLHDIKDQISLDFDYNYRGDGLFLVQFSFQTEENYKNDVSLLLSIDQIRKFAPFLTDGAVEEANNYILDASRGYEKEFGSNASKKIDHKYFLILALLKEIAPSSYNDKYYNGFKTEKDLKDFIKKVAKVNNTLDRHIDDSGETVDGKEYDTSIKPTKDGKINVTFGTTVSFNIDDIVREVIKYRDDFQNKNKSKILEKDKSGLPNYVGPPKDFANKVSKFKNAIEIIDYIVNKSKIVTTPETAADIEKYKKATGKAKGSTFYQEQENNAIEISSIAKSIPGVSGADVMELIKELEKYLYASIEKDPIDKNYYFSSSEINGIKTYLRAVLNELSPGSATQPTVEEAAPVADQTPEPTQAVAAEDGKEPANITEARAQLKKLIKSGMTFMGGRQRDQADALRKTIAEYEQSVKAKKGEANAGIDTSKEDKQDEQRSEVSAISEAVTDTLTNIEGSKDLMKALNGSKTKQGLVQKFEEQVSAAEEAIDNGDQQALSDAADSMSELLNELTGVRDELQDKHDNTPESLQETDAYYAREEAIDSLTEAIDTIESSISNLVESINTKDDNVTTTEDTTAEAEMKKGEFNLSGEDVTEVKNQAEDTTGDMVPDTVEPAYVAQARTQLAKLEKSGKGERQQQTLRETIAEYEASKGKPAQEAPKPEKKSKKTKAKKEPKPYKPSTIDVIRQRIKDKKYLKKPTEEKPYTLESDTLAVYQYEEDRKLFSFDRSVEISLVSTEALEEFERLAKERSSEITSEFNQQFTGMVSMELEKRQLETDPNVTSYGDIIQDLKSLAARGIFLPTLPKEYNAEELEKFKGLFNTHRHLFRNPPGTDVNKVNADQFKSYGKTGKGRGRHIDLTHRQEMKDKADGMISDVSQALAGLGWTQLDPSNAGNHADMLAELIANNDEGVIPAGGVGGATRNMDDQYKRRYTPAEPETLSNIDPAADENTDQQDEGDGTNPYIPPEDGDTNPFSMRDDLPRKKREELQQMAEDLKETATPDDQLTEQQKQNLAVKAEIKRDEAPRDAYKYPITPQFKAWTRGWPNDPANKDNPYRRRVKLPILIKNLDQLTNPDNLIKLLDGFVTTAFHGTSSPGRQFTQFRGLTYFVGGEDFSGTSNYFGEKDMYYLRCTKPAVLTEPMLAYLTYKENGKYDETGKFYTPLGELGYELERFFKYYSEKNPQLFVGNEFNNEDATSHIEDFLMSLENGTLYSQYTASAEFWKSGAQHQLVEWLQQNTRYDSVLFMNKTLSPDLPTIVMFNQLNNRDGVSDSSNIKAASNFGKFRSQDARFNYSLRDNPSTPSGEVANHNDADLASRGFVSKYAKENMPEGMNLTLTFGMGPRRSGVKPSQVSNYQGGMANGTLMNRGKVIATFEFDVEAGSSEYDGGAILHWVGVTESRRNLGLSKIMVAEIAERARRLGATTISATVMDQKQRPIASLKSVLGNVVQTEEHTRADPLDESDFSYIDKYGDRVVSRTEATSDIDPNKPLSLREKAGLEEKAAELDRRIKLNAANKYLGTLIGRRGYQGIIDRAVFEARKSGKLSEKEIQGLTSILNYIGSHFFANVKLSIDKGNENANAMGQYDAAQKIIKIFKTAINNGLFLDTAAHEIAHHLTQFLPEADRVALRKEWKDARTKFLKENPGFASLVGNDDRNWMNIRIKGTDLEAASKIYPDISKNKLFAQIPNSNPNAPIMYKVIATDETYRLFSSSEWFAETFKDTVNKRLNSDPAYTGNQKTWRDKLTNLWENIKMKFRQMFGKDQAARILANFAKGRYDASKFQENNGTNVNAEGYDVSTQEDARTIKDLEAESELPNKYVDTENESNNEELFNSIRDAEDQAEEDSPLIKPKGKVPVTRRVADFVTMRYAAGISNKAHQNAERNPQSKILKKIANLIHNRSGTKSDAFERDIPTSISVKRTQLMNKFRDIISPIRDTLNNFKDTKTKTAKQLREEMYKHLNDMITGRSPITAGPLGETATKLKELLQEIRDYRVEAGEEIGFVEDYFPVVYDQGLITKEENRPQFIGDATAAYLSELHKLGENELAKELGLTKEEIEAGDLFEDPEELERKMTELAQNKAIALYNAHVRGEANSIFDNMFGDKSGVNIENPAMSRKFGRQAQDIMRKWQVNDPFRVVTRYIMGSVKRAELIRRFGMDNKVWKGMAEQMEKDGVNYNTIIETANLIKVATGATSDSRSPDQRRLEQNYIDTLTLITAASAMGKGFWNNLAEPISIGIRSGSPIVGTINAYLQTWGVFFKLAAKDILGAKEKGIFADSFWEEYGKDMGLLHNDLNDAWMTTHSIDAGGEESDPRMRWMTNLVYKANLMDASETAKQRASLAIGHSYINNLANLRQGNHWFNKLVKKLGLSDANWNPSQSVSDNLNELGIPPQKHDQFTKWVAGLKGLQGASLMAMITGNSEMAKLHQEAIVRFSHQSSVRTSRAHKPVFQDKAAGKTYLQLLSFAYSYAAEVSSRVYDMTKQAVLFSPEGKRYNMVDRMRMLAPAVGAILSVAVYYGLLEFKDWLYDTEGAKKRKGEAKWLKWINAVSYSGLLGPQIEQLFKMLKREQTVGGPAGKMVADTGRAIQTAAGVVTGSSTDESAAKSLRRAAAPALKSGIVIGATAVNPALGAAAVQATNSKTFNDAVIPPKAEKSWFEKKK